MDDQTAKTIAVFDRPFRLPGFDETLPAGEYDIETELASPPDHKDPQAWKTSVVVHLHPRLSHPGLTRSLSVSLADLDFARARDKLSGKDLSQVFLEEMLADPMEQLVMQADGVSEAQWTCPVFVPLRLLTYAAFASKAKGLFQPSAECLRRGL